MRFVTWILCAAALVGCSSNAVVSGSDAGSVVRVPVTISTSEGDVAIQSEIADTPAARQRGLMFRDSMGDLEGMLFLFPDEKQRSFWMKNTLIPLDIIFIRADRTILGIVENATPKTTTSRSVPGDSQFVLELKGGRAKQLQIAADQAVTFLVPIPDR